MVNNFWKALSDVPAVDINFFGLANDFEPRFVRRVYGTLEASCIFSATRVMKALWPKALKSK